MAAPKKSTTVNWPMAVIILGLIATLAGLFSPLITSSDSKSTPSKSDFPTLSVTKTMVTDLKNHSSKLFEKLRSEQREDMKYLRHEISAIKESILQNARDIPRRSKGKRTRAGYLYPK